MLYGWSMMGVGGVASDSDGVAGNLVETRVVKCVRGYMGQFFVFFPQMEAS